MILKDILSHWLKRRRWFYSAIGNSQASVTIDHAKIYSLSRGQKAQKDSSIPSTLILRGSKGNLGDALDDFLFCYTEISPDHENFDLSATFTVKEVSSSVEWQAGYGLFAVDSVANARPEYRYRNYLAVGRFRTRSATRHSAGIRIVSGYKDPSPMEVLGNRIVDLSRDAHFTIENSKITAGECFRFQLKKTNDGFTGSLRSNNQEESFFIPGCDFLMKQEPHKIYIGFALAGTMTLEVSDIRLVRSFGKSSLTPENTIQMALPDYPFPRDLLEEPKAERPALSSMNIYAAPTGSPQGNGSDQDPIDLQTALTIAQPGQTILLKDGIYSPQSPYYIAQRNRTPDARRILLKAEHDGKAILDGSHIPVAAPLMVLRDDRWHLKDLVVCHAPLSGLFICGNDNRIEHCEAFENQDTGILICSYPGTKRPAWPKNNHVIGCDSHHNADKARQNADGFGAKLSIGEGNLFYECISHHNVDDGFDLFSKNVLGPIGVVVIENCVAYENGRSKEDEAAGRTGGTGFKLGGDNVAIPHRVKNCIAFLNHDMGFGTNYNPSTRMENVTAWHNGRIPLIDNYQFITGRTDIPTDWQTHGLLPSDSVYSITAGQRSFPKLMQENPEKSLETLSEQQEAALRSVFVSTDTSTITTIPITRGENDLIDMHGLFTLRQNGVPEGADVSMDPLPGAKLDQDHLSERLQRKQELLR